MGDRNLDKAIRAVLECHGGVMTIVMWRDVKTTIPSNERLVLVVIDGCVLTGNYFRNGNAWLINGEYENGRVTHWAELPEPPNQKETN